MRRVAGEHGFEVDVHEFPEGTTTAVDTVDAVGCDIEQIERLRISSTLTQSNDGIRRVFPDSYRTIMIFRNCD